MGAATGVDVARGTCCDRPAVKVSTGSSVAKSAGMIVLDEGDNVSAGSVVAPANTAAVAGAAAWPVQSAGGTI